MLVMVVVLVLTEACADGIMGVVFGVVGGRVVPVIMIVVVACVALYELYESYALLLEFMDFGFCD